MRVLVKIFDTPARTHTGCDESAMGWGQRGVELEVTFTFQNMSEALSSTQKKNLQEATPTETCHLSCPKNIRQREGERLGEWR